ncbi:MAG TPA: carboxypeptidase-like regulatory domain-containing protein [Gemmatimonadaceae bacterium]|nr:carboxypeptidase-like regulatory domain-containing protein [Gemmatimonadaceae bacterium]
MPNRLAPVVLALILACLGATGAAHAQTTDVIRGRVVGPDSTPIAGVHVSATSFSGNVTRQATTNADGRFTITFPNGDGDYMVAFNAPGFALKRFEVKRTADQAILVADTRLSRSIAELDTVKVQGTRKRVSRRDADQPDISGTQARISSENLSVAQQGNLAAMAASLPGVMYLAGANGDPSGYSVLGLDGSQNSATLNGMDFGGSNIPRSADVSSSLITSPYDVSRGGFSGGQLNLRTSSGTNFIRRSGSLLFDAPPMQWTDPAASALGQRYTNANLSGLVSGPIQFNQSFYNIAYQLGRRSSGLRTLLNTSPLGLQTAGIAQDSVQRLLGILGQDNVPATTAGIPGQQLSDQGMLLGSFDFAPPTSSTGQAFNLTVNGSWLKFNPLSTGPTELPAHSGSLTNWNASGRLGHSAYFGFGILSESGLSITGSRRASTPYLDLPSGNVRVASDFTNDSTVTSGVQMVSFGGSPFLNSTSTTQGLDVSNQLSWFSVDNKHRLQLTTDLRRDAYALDQGANHLGTFAFNSLADLQNGTPSSFTRTLLPSTRNGSEWTAGLSLGDAYRYSDNLQVQYGVRVDGTRFATAPDFNPQVQQVFGTRNDGVPNRVYVSPRVGFSWSYGVGPQVGSFLGAVRGPRAVVRGGVGVFQNLDRVTAIGQAVDNTGLPTGLQQLTCVGAATPVPDWNAYNLSQDSIPTRCADGTLGTVFSNSAPNVTLFGRDYHAPRSVRSNLQWSGEILDNRFNATFGATYSLNLDQASVVDLNFNPTTRFQLPDEASRPVFVQPGSVVPGSGAIASADAHQSAAFNRVMETRSDMQSRSTQLQVRLSPVGFHTNFNWNLAYTYQTVRDEQRGFGGGSTDGNPYDVSWGRSAYDSRHQVTYSLGYNFFNWVRVNWNGSVRSGTPFTPMVAGDINGDGYANDRAYVFDPAQTPDPVLASAMQDLLTSSSSRVRDCLRRQLGSVARRNSCEGPWTSSASMAIAFNPIKMHMPKRATLSLEVSNPLGAADLLLHGQSHTHGWGQQPVPDASLLYVRGFDPGTQRFRYDVNPRFGATSPQFTTMRAPVTLTAMLSVDLGPPRERQLLLQALDQGRSHQGIRLTEPVLRALYGSGGLVNPLATILRQSDTLQLTPQQADSVAMLNRWYIVHLDSIWTPVARYLATLPSDYDEDEAYRRYLRGREGSVDLLLKLSPDVRGLLTDAQRRKLPDLVASYLDPRYLAAIRSGSQGVGNMGFGSMGGMAAMAAGGQMSIVISR